MIRVNARSALVLAIGLLLGFAEPSCAAGDTDAHSPMLSAHPDNRAPPSAARPAAETQAVADQLNEVDRSLPDSAALAQPAATASNAPAGHSAPATAASSEHSIWNETSLIGKVFIGFGTVLTIASAARMFMA